MLKIKTISLLIIALLLISQLNGCGKAALKLLVKAAAESATKESADVAGKAVIGGIEKSAVKAGTAGTEKAVLNETGATAASQGLGRSLMYSVTKYIPQDLKDNILNYAILLIIPSLGGFLVYIYLNKQGFEFNSR